MKRCWYCERLIWPWQRRGWLTGSHGSRLVWHASCYGRKEP